MRKSHLWHLCTLVLDCFVELYIVSLKQDELATSIFLHVFLWSNVHDFIYSDNYSMWLQTCTSEQHHKVLEIKIWLLGLLLLVYIFTASVLCLIYEKNPLVALRNPWDLCRQIVDLPMIHMFYIISTLLKYIEANICNSYLANKNISNLHLKS